MVCFTERTRGIWSAFAIVFAYSVVCIATATASQPARLQGTVTQTDEAVRSAKTKVEWVKVPEFLVGEWEYKDELGFIWHETFGSQRDKDGHVWEDMITPRLKIAKRGLVTIVWQLDEVELVHNGPSTFAAHLIGKAKVIHGLIHAKIDGINEYNRTSSPDRIWVTSTVDGKKTSRFERRVSGFVQRSERCGVDLVRDFESFIADPVRVANAASIF